MGGLVLGRVLIMQLRRGLCTDRVLVVGTGAGSELLLHRMTMFPQYGYRVCGVLDDRLEAGSSFAGSTVLGPVADLPKQVKAQKIDQVFLALPGASHEQMLHL